MAVKNLKVYRLTPKLYQNRTMEFIFPYTDILVICK